MRIKNLLRQVTLLTSVGFLSAACSTLFSCRLDAGATVPIFGFDLNKNALYRGSRIKPVETVQLNDPRLEKEMVALWRSDWTFVLSYCNKGE